MKYKLEVATSFITYSEISLHERYGFVVEDKAEEDNSAYISSFEVDTFIEIGSLEDLEKLQEEWDSKIVLNSKCKKIMIYNGYLE